MIPRFILALVLEKITDKKALVITGPRQAGKTTLIHSLADTAGLSYLWLNGDEPDVREMLMNVNSGRLRSIIGDKQLIVIDEAQRIENIGLTIKLLTDVIKDVKVIASGSSAFELANKINEPLTGRKWEYILLPLSMAELCAYHGLLEERRMLETRLIYGSYPEIVTSPGNEKELLNQLADSYLYRDLLTWDRILKPDRLEKLVQALAFQVGSEVSYQELGQMTGLDNETVEKYISLLEKAYVVFRLQSLSRNLRNELKKSRKVYFYDNGIRNAVIRQFNPLALRNDTGQLWENYMVSERRKFLFNKGEAASVFFWRTTTQKEIDFIEEKDGKMQAFEFKWNASKPGKVPAGFQEAYTESEYQVVHPGNYQDYLL